MQFCENRILSIVFNLLTIFCISLIEVIEGIELDQHNITIMIAILINSFLILLARSLISNVGSDVNQDNIGDNWALI